MADGLNDLAIVPITSSDNNYFLRKVTGLKIDKTYSFKFQWVFEDDTKSDWSPGYQIATPTENVPSAPSVTVPTISTGSIPVTLSSFPANAKRVDIYVIGGEFGTGKVADYFLSAGTKSIAVAGGSYQVSLITVTPSGINGDPTNTFTINVSTAGETIQAPTNPNGFSIDRVLSGIQVNWAGTYANGIFTGFEAIKIYVGNLATATVGSYKEAGVMTGNNVKNAITIPVDGTYLRYDLPVYIHAAGVNKNGVVGTIQVNVANNSQGARSAIGSDLSDLIITNGKLVDDAITAAKIATAAITTTKIADDAITTPKLVANAITADKIVSSAITADKIATNAITAGKILAGTIDVSKLAAGTISVNNLEAGLITATSYIRAGGSTGARVELSSSNISGGPSAGFYIYNSAGTAILSAPLTGGLSITGGGSFTGDISGASGTFAGNLTASNGLFSVNNGILTAQSGTIGGWDINGTQLRSTGTNSITLNPNTPKIALLQSGVEKITIDPVEGIKDSAGNFSLTPTGILTLKGSITSGSTITGSTVTGSTINLSGLQSGYGSGSSYTENSDTSNKLNFSDARYTIMPASDTWTETVSIPSYDYINDEWTSTTTTTNFTSNTIKFTDSVFKGSIPTSAYYYGETWYEGGNSSGSIINYVNYLGGYLGFEIRANTTEKGFYFIGDSSIAGQNWGVQHLTTSSKDQPAMLQTDANGKVTRGRAIFTTGSSSTTILGATWTSVGQNGDLAFSTNN